MSVCVFIVLNNIYVCVFMYVINWMCNTMCNTWLQLLLMLGTWIVKKMNIVLAMDLLIYKFE